MICYASSALFVYNILKRHITCLSTGNHRWVINAQTGPVFWRTLYLLRKPSYSQFCPKFCCHGNGGQLG